MPEGTLPRSRWIWLPIAIALLSVGIVVFQTMRDPAQTRSTAPASDGDTQQLPRVAQVPNASPPAMGRQPVAESASAKMLDETSVVNDQQAFIVTPEFVAREKKRLQILDPREEGSQIEVYAARAKTQLEQILTLCVPPSPTSSPFEPTQLIDVVAEGFACPPLRPAQLQRVYRDDTVAIQRATPSSLRADAPHTGAEGLASALLSIHKTLSDADSLDTSVEVYAIQLQQQHLTTRVRLELNSRPPANRTQIRTNWDCSWIVQDEQLRLLAIQVVDYEEVFTRFPEADWFVDRTVAALGNNESWPRQLVHGLDYWLQRIERIHGMHTFMACGVALGDANGDDLDDLYVCQPGGLPNRLFLQNLDGTATDVSLRAHVDWLESTSSALWIDLDNDTDQDLVLATPRGILVMSNDGEARFELVATLSNGGADSQSLSAADYDNDGDLDLYVCSRLPEISSPPLDRTQLFVFDVANDGAPNRLFRNNFVPRGTWSFSDVTQSTGLDVDNRGHTLAASWEDYDNDGDQDLYVANDDGQDCLYQNDDGHFVDVAAQVGMFDPGCGTSVGWGDYDRDGLMDLYVGNVYSSAASRVTLRPWSRLEADRHAGSNVQRFAKGNLLFHNRGQGHFEEVSAAAKVNMGRWAQSSLFLDLNNSGWEDLVVANGYITTDNRRDLSSLLWRQVVSQGDRSLDSQSPTNRRVNDEDLNVSTWIRDGHSIGEDERHCGFLNMGGSQFADISSISNLDFPDDGRAIAVSDWDQDGDLDLWIANRNGPQVRLLLNDIPTNHHYLSVRLVGTDCNPDAIGARVTMFSSGTDRAPQLRTLRAGDGYLSQSSKWLHFGLGTATQIDRIEVRWPGGEVESFRGIVPDAAYRLTQGTAQAESVPRGERPIRLPSLPDASAKDTPPHVLLSSRVPLPSLPFIATDGETRLLTRPADQPLLITLWSPWYPPCLAELAEFTARRDELESAGLKIVALAGDHLAAQPATTESWEMPLSDIGFTGTSGKAPVGLLDTFETVRRQVFDRQTRLPIPSSFLISPDGQLAALYLGPVTVDRVLNDVAKLDLDTASARMASLPFPGQWLGNLQPERQGIGAATPHKTRQTPAIAKRAQSRSQSHEATAVIPQLDTPSRTHSTQLP